MKTKNSAKQNFADSAKFHGAADGEVAAGETVCGQPRGKRKNMTTRMKTKTAIAGSLRFIRTSVFGTGSCAGAAE